MNKIIISKAGLLVAQCQKQKAIWSKEHGGNLSEIGMQENLSVIFNSKYKPGNPAQTRVSISYAIFIENK